MYPYIHDNVRRILKEIPPEVSIVAAAKTRTHDEIMAAVEAGIQRIGENYIQEAATAYDAIGGCVKWHFIGHLQLNKVKKAVEIFDLIETVDSLELAEVIDRQAAVSNKIMPVLIEVNIGRETQKNGVMPEALSELAEAIDTLPNLQLRGLMTMGPYVPAEQLRPYFAETRRLFDQMQQAKLVRTDIRYLSMGMSDSYRVAIEEGANLVRLGTAIFGPRR
ncbi:YggS family pyridoxal phosphate-dependent enzyme [Dehalogenimonas sp. THU2]|uniref:YggS family pyridoxal phosphate-dependent enzyme n=1 Tax=Dehalogenimonas sp. THU2 TaxID=3151121 RepID=UPI003218B678